MDGTTGAYHFDTAKGLCNGLARENANVEEVYFSDFYTVSSSTGCYGRTGLPIFHDVVNCEELYAYSDKCLCVLIKDVCKNSNEGNLAGCCVRVRVGVSLYVGLYGIVDVTE